MTRTISASTIPLSLEKGFARHNVPNEFQSPRLFASGRTTNGLRVKIDIVCFAGTSRVPDALRSPYRPRLEAANFVGSQLFLTSALRSVDGLSWWLN
jgi:hypothetical protein